MCPRVALAELCLLGQNQTLPILGFFGHLLLFTKEMRYILTMLYKRQLRKQVKTVSIKTVGQMQLGFFSQELMFRSGRSL